MQAEVLHEKTPTTLTPNKQIQKSGNSAGESHSATNISVAGDLVPASCLKKMLINY